MRQLFTLGFTGLAFTLLSATSVKAVQVIYTFEPPNTVGAKDVTDRALGDGAQNPISWLSTGAIDTTAAFGTQAGHFPGPNGNGVPSRAIDTGITSLGPQFTLAAMINDPNYTTQFRRTFSNYTGGALNANEFIFDHLALGGPATGMYLRIPTGNVFAPLPASFANSGYHHLAVTYNQAAGNEVIMYADGVPFLTTTLAFGAPTFGTSIRFGDDAPPTDGNDERFVGHADDVVIWDSALSASQIMSLSLNGAEATLISSLAGDLNGDGFVGQDDFNIVLGDWGNMPPADPRADPSGDGFVGQDDLNPVLADWGQGTPPVTLAGSSLSAAAVPEPSSILLLAMAIPCGLTLYRRCRRRAS